LNEGDHTELMPATIEELAADRRANPARGRRGALIAAGVAGALVLVGGGWAIASGGSAETPLSPAALSPRPTHGFVDGFGVGSPVPPPSPISITPPTSSPKSGSPSPSKPASPRVSATAGQPLAGSQDFTASISTQYWERGMWVEVTVVNEGSQPLVWQLNLELSPRVMVGQPWNAVIADREDDYLRLTAPSSYSPLAPGKTAKVGFVGVWEDGSRQHTITGCTLNGRACTGLS
jgi:hypothetical protein